MDGDRLNKINKQQQKRKKTHTKIVIVMCCGENQGEIEDREYFCDVAIF